MPLPISTTQLRKKLTETNVVSPEQFDKLAREAEHKNQNLFDVLVSQRVIDAYSLNNLIASALGIELADLASRGIDASVVTLLPEEIARQRQVVLFKRESDGSLDAAMADPGDLETIQFLSQHLKTKVNPFLAAAEDLNRGFAIYGSQAAADVKREIEEQIQASLRTQKMTIEEAAAQLPIVAIVDSLLAYALSSRASDIHLEILEDATLVRYRIDGILHEIMRMPRAIHPALVARVKLLSGLKIDEHYRPQDGRFRYQIALQVVDIRVSAMPTFYGEKIVMRLLEATQKPPSLQELGMFEDTAEVVQRNLKKAYGMLLSCGPTGSGKTTTLYSLINILNRQEVNIVTTEDPIEYNMRYVNQTQINPAAGITFATSLRSILRQDPNIIMVGEIRDGETAEIAVQAALTGHLLLSSLHTNDAPTSIPRLFDLGVPPFLATATLNAIVAQRLARRICQFCMYSYAAGAELKEIVGEQLKQINIDPKAVRIPRVLYRGKGCTSCGETGYRGRVGVFEVLELSDDVKKIIASKDFNIEALRDAARANGMKTMFEDGMRKVELAITTIEEVLRVIRE